MNNRRSKVAKPIFTHTPPAWCAELCRNCMNEDCITHCAPKRNTAHFELKEAVNLEDLARFPQRAWQGEMTSAERQAIAGVYLKVIADHLKGIRNEPSRTYPDSIGNRRLLEALKKQGLSVSTEESNPPSQNGQVGTNSGV